MDFLSQRKFNGDLLGVPLGNLFFGLLLLGLILNVRAGMMLADRFEPGRNKFITGVMIGAAAFWVSIVLGFLLWLFLSRDMVG